MVGVPVIINHKDLNSENVGDERVGVVNSVWYDEKDGWYWCDGIIWDETAQNLITDNNWSVSCSYDVKTADDKGGTENNIKYDIEFLDGVFTHLALVNNPRYERANIVFNSKPSFKDEFINTFYEALAEVVVENCLGELRADNDFPNHEGRPGQRGGSLPKERDIKYNLTDLLGEEIKGFTGQDAINKVYKERKGHVKDAFYKEGIGNITVCWGDDTCGLKHLEQERLDRNQDPKEIIHSLGKIIKNGHIFKEEDDRWKIRYKDATVIISKELKNEKAVAIITGYKSNKKVSKN